MEQGGARQKPSTPHTPTHSPGPAPTLKESPQDNYCCFSSGERVRPGSPVLANPAGESTDALSSSQTDTASPILNLHKLCFSSRMAFPFTAVFLCEQNDAEPKTPDSEDRCVCIPTKYKTNTIPLALLESGRGYPWVGCLGLRGSWGELCLHPQ